jgi:AraC-like DNA-binding protein
MIAACFRTSAEAVARARPALEATLLERIRGRIETMLGSSGLNADALCQTFGLSRSALYRLFEPLGGVAGYIQTRRLMRAHADLADPGKAPRKIYEVAYRWGFVSEAHFSRAFRRAFGVTPGEVRAGAGGVLSAAESSLIDLGSERAYRGWLRSLRHQ